MEREATSNNMPPRDKKTTGYRYEPGDARSLEAVRLMFDMYDSGMEFGAISESLWRQGFKHYDKPFGYHGVETILSNTGYIGKPAWGKLGVGEYRHAIDKKPTAPQRKKDDTLTVKKPEAQWIYPTTTVFPPVVPVDLFERVKQLLAGRAHVNPSFGKRRTRDKATHPLNGKLFCPDCDCPMVLGSFTPGAKTMKKTKGKAKKKHCFVCGTYRKSIRTRCHANTVAWDKLDAAVQVLLKLVADRIDMVKTGNVSKLFEQEWLKRTEFGRTIAEVVKATLPELSPEHREFVGGAFETIAKRGILLQPDMLESTFTLYDHDFTIRTAALREELATINEELDAIVDELLLQRRKNPRLAERLDAKAATLEARQSEIEPKLVPLTEQARSTMAQLQAIRDTIREADTLKVALLLDSFIEKVYPVFEVKKTKSKTKPRRTEIIGFRFIPRATAKHVLNEEMKVSYSRTGTGSST